MNQLLHGMRIFENPFAVRKVTTRIRGGYMNRWLIRAQVNEPCFYIDDINNIIHCHPYLLPEIRKWSVRNSTFINM